MINIMLFSMVMLNSVIKFILVEMLKGMFCIYNVNILLMVESGIVVKIMSV